MHNSAGSDRCLVPAGGTLDMAFRQCIALLLPTFGTDEPIGPSLGYKVFPAACLVAESQDELDQTKPFFLRHDPFPRFSVSCLYFTARGVP